MEKSRGTTDQRDRFYGERHARLQEWGWACLFLGALFAFRLWQRHESASNWPCRPQAEVEDLLSWAERLPGFVMRVHPRKPSDARKSNADDSPKGQTEWLGRIELNVADAQAFQKLAGVGPVLSQRIVRFRDALGGFSSVEDLYDVYGLDSSVVNRTKPVLSVDAELVRPLCLDTVSFRTLLKHPRFDLETTKKLMRARGRGVHAFDAVLTSSRLDSLTLCKVRPYLEVCSSL